jgi:hypothetical protein
VASLLPSEVQTANQLTLKTVQATDEERGKLHASGFFIQMAYLLATKSALTLAEQKLASILEKAFGVKTSEIVRNEHRGTASLPSLAMSPPLRTERSSEVAKLCEEMLQLLVSMRFTSTQMSQMTTDVNFLSNCNWEIFSAMHAHDDLAEALGNARLYESERLKDLQQRLKDFQQRQQPPVPQQPHPNFFQPPGPNWGSRNFDQRFAYGQFEFQAPREFNPYWSRNNRRRGSYQNGSRNFRDDANRSGAALAERQGNRSGVGTDRSRSESNGGT